MSISKLPKKPNNQEEFIHQGGTVKEEGINAIKILVRIPSTLLSIIDEERAKKMSKPSRNQFILELLDTALKVG